eukprot:620203-Rhodomonas_salina.2
MAYRCDAFVEAIGVELCRDPFAIRQRVLLELLRGLHHRRPMRSDAIIITSDHHDRMQLHHSHDQMQHPMMVLD